MARIGRGKNFEKTKSKLLHTVAKMFLERGYHKTTLRDVSEASGVAYSSLINVFGSKEGMLSELVAYVLEGQFLATEKLLSGVTEDKILFYAAETTLQLYMAESHEHIREMYSVSYSLPETSRIIYDTITHKLENIFAEHLPELETKDFYCLEIASGGIMRSFMTVPCDMFFTMEMKVRFFLESTFRVYLVPEEKIAEAIAFVSKFDYKTIAENVISNMLAFLESKT
ncbi:MAG: TetR/AcrR family transcriptional regulator [Clostridia bacterium]|nr:TetR/AcrR family transcriptional regulator [Clostridia bacterium]